MSCEEKRRRKKELQGKKKISAVQEKVRVNEKACLRKKRKAGRHKSSSDSRDKIRTTKATPMRNGTGSGRRKFTPRGELRGKSKKENRSLAEGCVEKTTGVKEKKPVKQGNDTQPHFAL